MREDEIADLVKVARELIKANVETQGLANAVLKQSQEASQKMGELYSRGLEALVEALRVDVAGLAARVKALEERFSDGK